MRLDKLIWITVLKPTTTALPQPAHDKESAEKDQQAAFFPSETTTDVPSSHPYSLSRPRILIRCLLWNHLSGSVPSYSSAFLHPLMETPSYRCLFNEIDEFLGMSQWLSVLLRINNSDHSFNCHEDSKGVADTQLALDNRCTLSAFFKKGLFRKFLLPSDNEDWEKINTEHCISIPLRIFQNVMVREGKKI